VHESHEDDKIHTIEELFPVGSQCFMLASPYYGASGEVIEIDVKQSRIRVQLHVPSEPDISSIIDQHQVCCCCFFFLSQAFTAIAKRAALLHLIDVWSKGNNVNDHPRCPSRSCS